MVGNVIGILRTGAYVRRFMAYAIEGQAQSDEKDDE